MAYSPHALCAFGGDLGTAPDSDIWVCTMRVADLSKAAGAQSLTDPVGYMNGLQARLLSWWNGMTTGIGISSAATLKWLKVNNITTAGKYAGPTNLYTYSSPSAGKITTLGQNWTQTVVLSWGSTLGNSNASSRGRIYLPWYVPASNNVFVSSANQQIYLNQAKTFLQCFTADGTTSTNTIVPVIASKKVGSLLAINQVRVGRVMDTQRRRRNKISESYLVSSWP